MRTRRHCSNAAAPRWSLCSSAAAGSSSSSSSVASVDGSRVWKVFFTATSATRLSRGTLLGRALGRRRGTLVDERERLLQVPAEHGIVLAHREVTDVLH